MICTLFLALQDQQIEWFLKSGTSIAMVCAMGWTLLQLGRTPAEVSFCNDRVRIKTFLETSITSDKEKWRYVIDVKKMGSDHAPAVTAITFGHTALEFKEADWKEFPLLTACFIEARQQYTNKISASTP